MGQPAIDDSGFENNSLAQSPVVDPSLTDPSLVDTAPIPIVRIDPRPSVPTRPPARPTRQRSMGSATSTTTRLRSSSATSVSASRSTPRLSWSVAAVSAALWSAGVGILATVVVVLIAWAAGGHDGPPSGDAIRAAGVVWLVAHHCVVTSSGATLSLLPIGLMVIPLALTYRAGTWVAGVAVPQSRREVVRIVGFATATYAAVAAFVSGGASLDAASVNVLAAMASAAAVSGVGFTFGILHGLPAARLHVARLRAKTPLALRDVVRASTVSIAVLVGAAAAVAGFALLTHLDEAAAVSKAVAPGPASGFFLALLGVAYVPNFVIWSLAYGLGTALSLGAGGSVSAVSVSSTAVPAFPLLAAVPDTPNPWARALVLVAIAAGALAGVTLNRTGRLSDWKSYAIGICGVTAMTGALLGLLGYLSAGALGTGRLAMIGPSPWAVALVGGGLVGLGALISVGVALAWNHRHRLHSLT